uniref:Transcription elongation factor SPT6 n=1 Tax=Trichogramma kaykai TaxID=54128 RepID=A0ABD2WU03_9HYME
MSQYIDSEAEESEEEMMETKRKMKRISSDESSEDEDEDMEEVKDLIDDRPIEEDDSDNSSDDDDRSPNAKRKRTDDDFDDRLDEEDYDVIEENLGVKVERKRFRRLKKIQDEESDNDQDMEADDERNAIANQLFEAGSGDEDEKSSPSRRDKNETEQYDDEEAEEESDADDFIVDDDGKPLKTHKKRPRIFADSALQEAQDIFGVDFDYDELAKFDGDYDEDEDEDEEDEYADEDDVGRTKKSKKASRRKGTKKSIFDIYEPSELKRGHFTDLDNEIRGTDIPERMQLRVVPVTPADEAELKEEGKWIYEQAFVKKTLSIQDDHLTPEAKEAAVKKSSAIQKIVTALDFMRNQFMEVPFIAFYRKEYYLTDLNMNDLWKIYKYDAKWCQLNSRKKALIKLFTRMKEYQTMKLSQDKDAPLPENIRIFDDNDLQFLKGVQNIEELNDCYNHFMLYYHEDVRQMQQEAKKYNKEKKKQERQERRKKLIAEAEENGEEPPPEEIEEDEDDAAEETLKQAARTGPYALCKKAGLEPFAKRFGLTPEDFAINLSEEYGTKEVEQDPMEASEIAKQYLGKKFQTTEEVLKAVTLMVAIQLSRQPLLRESVRKLYRDKATITVKPTKKGLKMIDESHPIYSMKYLKEKPVKELKGDEYLKLLVAQEDKLIELTFSDKFQTHGNTNYIDHVASLYQRDEFSKNVQEWNTLRKNAVNLALSDMVIPDLKKELKAILLSEAKDCVLRHCTRKMYNWIKHGPYKVDKNDFEESDEEWSTSKGLRVMGLAYVPDFSVAAFACLVTPDGDCSDYLKLPHILKKKNSYRDNEKQLKMADLRSLRNFIETKKPHVIVIGGESREATMIAEDLKEVVNGLMVDEQFPKIEVEIIENELSFVYANSNKGVAEFRDYPDLLRQAISLARRMQDPLVEFSQLCNADDEILCLKYHPLQDQISKEDLLEGIHQEFINRVNEVGVDINQVVLQPYYTNLVQFICGLGQRKGQYLIKMLKQTNQRLENRTQLVTSCHMGPKVFVNCAGFIRIDTNSLGDSTEAYVEVLDGSRVHPETYEWARKMAVDALEYDDQDANPAGALEEILEAPHRLKELDLDAFAEELERQGFGNKGVTLYDIRSELDDRYKDLRPPFQSYTPDQLFTALVKETPETFYVGKLLEATVIGISYRKPKGDQLDQANPVRNDETGLWQCPFCLKNSFPELSEVWNHFDAGSCPGKAVGVRLRLDNGLSGYINIKNLSDKHVDNPEERVRIGHRIHVRVIKIEPERFGCECTSRGSDLQDVNKEWKPQKDLYYDTDAEKEDIKKEEDLKKGSQRQVYVTRVIIHPSFKNITYIDAENLMATMQQGEAIIRPSSKGEDHLTVTWKVAEGVHQHIDVLEKGKENKYSLGKSLFIGNEEFEDLDEIIARHINPMAAFASELIEYKYYKPQVLGNYEKAEEILRQMKKENENSIPYILSACQKEPGRFLLSYLPREKCGHEKIQVSHEGYEFRLKRFQRVMDLIRWFKEHYRDPIPGKATPASSTPRAFPTTPALNVVNGVSTDAIQRVAQNMPRQLYNQLSQVATNATPHYTPYVTPYQTPVNPTPRYGENTPSSTTPHHHHHHHHQYAGSNAPDDWRKAAEAWVVNKTTTPVYRSSGTPRPFKQPYKSPRGTPHTNSSPRSMSLSGDGTPLYDES